jgi:hypothetical protein
MIDQIWSRDRRAPTDALSRYQSVRDRLSWCVSLLLFSLPCLALRGIYHSLVLRNLSIASRAKSIGTGMQGPGLARSAGFQRNSLLNSSLVRQLSMDASHALGARAFLTLSREISLPLAAKRAFLGVGCLVFPLFAFSSDLPAPTGVSASDGVGIETVTITWTAVADAKYYALYRSASDRFEDAERLKYENRRTSTTDSPTPGETWYYWVTAVQADWTEGEPGGPDSGFAVPLGVGNDAWDWKLAEEPVPDSPGVVLEGEDLTVQVRTVIVDHGTNCLAPDQHIETLDSDGRVIHDLVLRGYDDCYSTYDPAITAGLVLQDVALDGSVASETFVLVGHIKALPCIGCRWSYDPVVLFSEDGINWQDPEGRNSGLGTGVSSGKLSSAVFLNGQIVATGEGASVVWTPTSGWQATTTFYFDELYLLGETFVGMRSSLDRVYSSKVWGSDLSTWFSVGVGDNLAAGTFAQAQGWVIAGGYLDGGDFDSDHARLLMTNDGLSWSHVEGDLETAAGLPPGESFWRTESVQARNGDIWVSMRRRDGSIVDLVGVRNYDRQMQEVYIAYYGRAADPDGQQWWAEQLREGGGDLSAVIQQFGLSAEFDESYGHLGSGELVDTVYLNMFGRAPDDAGRAFYVGQLETGTMTLQTVTLDILNGAQNEDATIISNKVECAEYFTSEVRSRGLSYTSKDIPDAREVLELVDERVESIDDCRVGTDSLLAALIITPTKTQ